jgi:hypothetical protein
MVDDNENKKISLEEFLEVVELIESDWHFSPLQYKT